MSLSHLTPVLFSLCAMVSVVACNGTSSTSQAQQTSDWINHDSTNAVIPPVVSVSPKPTPTPSATATPTAQLYSGPAELAKYVQKFIDDGKAEGLDVTANMKNPILTIQIGSLASYGSTTIGLCESGTGLRTVTFSPTFWNNADETQRELVVHHELGHCVLSRPHRTDTLPTGEVASIMYPVIQSDPSFTSNETYYLNELFTYGRTAAGSSAQGQEAPAASPDKDGITRYIN